MSTASARRERWIAALLVTCVAIVAFWQVTSWLAERPYKALRLSAEHFSGFSPSDIKWKMHLVHIKATPTEPTVIAYDVRPRGEESADTVASAPVLVRLVHGYNMVDCMRIKQYRVELLSDTRRRGIAPGDAASGERTPVQIWRLNSPGGDRTVWVTTMLRASDFGATDTDTRDMTFPRVGTPDDPAWAPSGLKWSSFQHPIRNFRLYLRSKWNASRSDLLTFLRLRQPAWASDIMLTMVSEYRGASVAVDTEGAAVAHVLKAHLLMLDRFQAHSRSRAESHVEE